MQATLKERVNLFNVGAIGKPVYIDSSNTLQRAQIDNAE